MTRLGLLNADITRCIKCYIELYVRDKQERFLLYTHNCVDLYFDIYMEKQSSSTILFENNFINLGMAELLL